MKDTEILLDPPPAASTPMKALVYHGPGRRSWEDKPRPRLAAATDAIVRMTTGTICSTDLHILEGDLPEVADGRILGHEGVGVVAEVGDAVAMLERGDKVLISCITACGRCDHCRQAMYSHCRDGGWVLGHTIDGTQAEYVRIPHAETSLYRLPADVDESALAMLSDVFPTAFECGVLNGQVTAGDAVAIVGAGPVGLATLLIAHLYSPAEIIVVDLDDHRLEVARSLGATGIINSADGLAASRIRDLTGGTGVDVAIEAVGIPATFDICQEIVAPGGRIANVGVHGRPVTLHLERLWAHNITITTRLVDTAATPMLLKQVRSGRLQPGRLVTHRFGLSDVMRAYDAFAEAAKERALKVVLQAD
jgi:alcohol dehydrogenase